MRKRLKKKIHLTLSAYPYFYGYFYFCKGLVKIEFCDLTKMSENYCEVTCKRCQREIKNQNRLEQGSKFWPTSTET